MINVVVDFETYYDKELSVVTLGLHNYVRQSDAYIVAVKTPGWSWCGPVAEFGNKFGGSWITDPDTQFWAANSNFDQAFWEKYFPKTAHPWRCVLDRAAFHQLPRDLAGVSRVHLKKTMDKATRDEMKGVRFESLTPERQKQVIDYCATDTERTWEIVHSLPPMSPQEEELAAHTRLINRRGIRVDVDKVARDITLLEELRHASFKKIPWVASGGAPLSHEQFAHWCELHGAASPASLDKRDLACVAWMKANPELAKIIGYMRTFRGTNTKVEKLKSILAAASDDNVIPLDMIYCGARHTRRWSSKNINVQNLDAKRVFTEEMAELPFFKEHPEEKPGIFMREYFLPPSGHVFGILDFSQIEPRCLNWIVGNDEMLDAIRAGYGIYEAHAKSSMGWQGAPGTLKHTEPDRYKFAKIRVLGLGYGMGAGRFHDFANSNGIKIDAATAEAQVADFRRTNPKITAQWRAFQTLIQNAIRDQERVIEITMPSGDLLQHFSVRGKGRDKGVESYTVRGDFSQASHIPNLFGGLLTENVTQRMARDVLAEAILRLEKAGLPVCFHAHDEVILPLPESSAKADFAEAQRIMSVNPDWCPDIPLSADGEIHSTYTKLQ
jgi:DNA polymerase